MVTTAARNGGGAFEGDSSRRQQETENTGLAMTAWHRDPFQCKWFSGQRMKHGWVEGGSLYDSV